MKWQGSMIHMCNCHPQKPFPCFSPLSSDAAHLRAHDWTQLVNICSSCETTSCPNPLGTWRNGSASHLRSTGVWGWHCTSVWGRWNEQEGRSAGLERQDCRWARKERYTAPGRTWNIATQTSISEDQSKHPYWSRLVYGQ